MGLYERLWGSPAVPTQPTNPLQMMNAFAQAMQNPAAFIRSRFQDIPADMSNDPNKILQYLIQKNGITQQQLQETQAQAMQAAPMIFGNR